MKYWRWKVLHYRMDISSTTQIGTLWRVKGDPLNTYISKTDPKFKRLYLPYLVEFSSVSQSCPTLWDHMDCIDWSEQRQPWFKRRESDPRFSNWRLSRVSRVQRTGGLGKKTVCHPIYFHRKPWPSLHRQTHSSQSLGIGAEGDTWHGNGANWIPPWLRV